MADRPGTSQPANGSGQPNAANEPAKKNRPKATRLRQQKLPAWQPILTASTVIPAIFVVGIVFLPIGVALYLASNGVLEFDAVYTDCITTNNEKASEALKKTPGSSVTCTFNIPLDKDYVGDVYFYYGLDNFYQNHRRYVKSRSDAQLVGDLEAVGDCAPYAYLNDTTKKNPYAPCGAVANSMFNDTFILHDSQGKEVPFTKEGIIWSVDRDKKFKNPPLVNGSLRAAFEQAGTVKPPNWQKAIYELDTDPKNNGFENVDFIVWMRTAALPNFRKLYRKLDRSVQGYENMLKAGTYTLKVNYQYPVKSFNGEKRFIISTTSWAGAKNSFLGIAYMVVGVFCLVLGVVFLGIHIKFGNSLTEISNVRSGAN